VDVRLANVPKPGDILKLVDGALKHVAAKQILLNPDCGFAPHHGEPPQVDEAFNKLKALADAAHLLRLRAKGKDPAHGGEAARKRGAKNAQHMKTTVQWERVHQADADPNYFKQKVLPRLQGVPLLTIMRAIGLSLDYCSKIRRGLRVPHPRHWEALRSIRIKDIRTGRSANPNSTQVGMIAGRERSYGR